MKMVPAAPSAEITLRSYWGSVQNGLGSASSWMDSGKRGWEEEESIMGRKGGQRGQRGQERE